MDKRSVIVAGLLVLLGAVAGRIIRQLSVKDDVVVVAGQSGNVIHRQSGYAILLNYPSGSADLDNLIHFQPASSVKPRRSQKL